VTTDPPQPKDSAVRIGELEAELAQMRRRLAVKEREIAEIHRSRAWRLVHALRSIKYRVIDPLLGAFGMAWPRRRAAVSVAVRAEIAPRGDAYDVICFSTCDWDARYQRPQQLMARFAAAGHRVFYVSQQFRANGPPCEAERKLDNIYEITLREARLDDLDALRRDASVDTAAMFVQFPSWWPLAREARARFHWPILYDCMDLHGGFSTVRQAMVAQEDQLIADADVVIASSAVLERRALRKRNDVLLLRNACDFAHFAKTPRANNLRPVIGYYGAIADWFDSTLVAELAARRPDWDFILVGSTYNADLSRLARLPNVSLPGEEAYESVPEWLGRFDVALIPFKRTPLTEATNPVKLYEMLAAGKPIVSVPIPEVAALVPLVRLASSAIEFEREVEAALREDAGAAEPRRRFARGETWQHRFDVLQAATASALSERA
jgi:glycosyltransferase involved in cell wall biosynthesis